MASSRNRREEVIRPPCSRTRARTPSKVVVSPGDFSTAGAVLFTTRFYRSTGATEWGTLVVGPAGGMIGTRDGTRSFAVPLVGGPVGGSLRCGRVRKPEADGLRKLLQSVRISSIVRSHHRQPEGRAGRASESHQPGSRRAVRSPSEAQAVSGVHDSSPVVADEVDVRVHPVAPRHRLWRIHRLCGSQPLQGTGDRCLRAGLHVGAPSRLRRRPHFGHRQHHPEADERGQEAGQCGLLLLVGPLHHRDRHRGWHRDRRKIGVRGGVPPPVRVSSSSAGSSAPSSPPLSCTSSPFSISSFWLGSSPCSGGCDRATSTRRNSRSSWRTVV